MKNLQVTATTAMLFSCMIGVAIAAPDSNPSREPTKEMLVGQYTCSTYPGYGPKAQGSLVVSGTTGMFVSGKETASLSLLIDLASGGLPICDAFARDARTRAQSVGCTAGQVTRIDPDSTNTAATRGVHFVCAGPRDTMVDSLTSLIELLVTNER